MTTYFTAPDGHGEETLWVQHPGQQPVSVLRKSQLDRPHHWDTVVARVIAGNPDRMIDRDALTQGIERVNNTDSLAAAIADRTENAAAALRVNELANDLTRTPSPPSQGLMQLMPVEGVASALRDAQKEMPPRLELTEEESDAFTAALQWDTPSPSHRPGCDHPNVKTTQFCPDCGTFVMVSHR